MKKGNIFKFIKRSFVVLLCAVLLFVCVIFSSSYKVRAAVPLVAGAALIVAALSSYMAASGVNIVSNSNSNGADVVSMWEDICSGYEADGKTLESWYGEAGNAVNILIGKENAQKFAIASTTVCSWFDGLREWILQKYGIDSTSPVTITGSQYFTDSNGKKIPYISNPNVSISVSQFRDCDSVMAINNNTPVNSSFSFSVSSYRYQFMVTSNNPTSQSSYGFMRFNIHNFSAGTTKSVGSNYFWRGNDSAKLLFVYTGSVLYAYIFSFISSSSSIYAGSQLFSLNVSNLATSSISVTGALSDGYQDLQDALNGAKTDAGVNGKIGIDIGDWDYTGTNTKEGVAEAYLDRIATTGTAEGTLTGGYTDEKEAEEENDADFVPSAAWYDKNLIVVDGLEDFFPFCIPFDLIDMIDKFNTAPEAPVIHWNMSFANLYDDQELVLDFSPWETAALIFRICCLIGFAIFLILKTRDIIRG